MYLLIPLQSSLSYCARDSGAEAEREVSLIHSLGGTQMPRPAFSSFLQRGNKKVCTLWKNNILKAIYSKFTWTGFFVL